MEAKNKPSNSKVVSEDELQKKIAKLELEIIKLETVIKENEWDDTRDISDTEAICIQQIRRLKDKSAYSEFCEADAKILDILHKNLRMARGEVTLGDRSKKAKKMSNEELFRLVGGGND